jgi:hypothetical protein
MKIWFILLYLIKISGSLNYTLSETLLKASGVYVTPNLSYNLDKTVLVTACNYGYLNHLHNFKCHTERLGFKVLVISLDQKTHNYVHEHIRHFYSYFFHGNGVVHETSTEFRSAQFHIITNRKKEAILEIMKLGYDVLFADPDVALLRDPFPYVLWKNVDYVHSVNLICPK